MLLANLAAMFLQRLAAKLGIVTGLDLAQACRRAYSPAACIVLWLLCELPSWPATWPNCWARPSRCKLLFGVPLVSGVALTGARSAAHPGAAAAGAFAARRR